MLTLIEYQVQLANENQRHDTAVKQLRAELRNYQKICKHNSGTNFWQDPSGNNGSWYECKECGAEI